MRCHPFGLAALALLLLSCAPAAKAPPPAATPAETEPVALTLTELALSSDEAAWLQGKVGRGEPLKAATFPSKGSYEVAADGTRSGLDWHLFQDLARVLGLRPDVMIPADPRSFFSRNGAIPPDLQAMTGPQYTPDLMKTVELYIGAVTALPWRERLMTTIPFYPMQNFLAGPKGREVQSLAQLSGQRIAVWRNSTQEAQLQSLSRSQGLQVTLVQRELGSDLVGEVLAGRADYTLDGGIFFASNLGKLGGLTLSPFPSEVERVGWAVRKTEPALAGIVRKYLKQAQNRGWFAYWFTRDMGTPFNEYMDLMARSLSDEAVR